MAGKRKTEETNPLNVALKVAEEMIDSASHVLSETVEVVSKLNKPLLKVEADIIEHVSPTAAELLRPGRKKKNEQSSEHKTSKVKARQAEKKASGQADDRPVTSTGKAPKSAAMRPKARKDKDR